MIYSPRGIFFTLLRPGFTLRLTFRYGNIVEVLRIQSFAVSQLRIYERVIYFCLQIQLLMIKKMQ